MTVSYKEFDFTFKAAHGFVEFCLFIVLHKAGDAANLLI
ncbi:hypothetical protein AB30_4989 [Escherichia coli 2-210-07_S1_C2]|nr:hypothetical protein AB62_5120 [Escherichia coli 2-210-07_S1_C3]KDW85643.1 hypothetical protein AB30_4989 [Escherichia coli 2-210-07_S1_C2]